MEKIFQANGSGGHASAAILTSDKIDFQLTMVNFINQNSFSGSDPKPTHLSLFFKMKASPKEATLQREWNFLERGESGFHVRKMVAQRLDSVCREYFSLKWNLFESPSSPLKPVLPHLDGFRVSEELLPPPLPSLLLSFYLSYSFFLLLLPFPVSLSLK